MLTEHISPRFVDLDSWSTSDMMGAMYDGQLAACAAVRPALPAINAADSAGDPTGVLPWIGNDDPICDAITMLLPAYATIEQAARARGFDPDNPPNLSKITETI